MVIYIFNTAIPGDQYNKGHFDPSLGSIPVIVVQITEDALLGGIEAVVDFISVYIHEFVHKTMFLVSGTSGPVPNDELLKIELDQVKENILRYCRLEVAKASQNLQQSEINCDELMVPKLGFLKFITSKAKLDHGLEIIGICIKEVINIFYGYLSSVIEHHDNSNKDQELDDKPKADKILSIITSYITGDIEEVYKYKLSAALNLGKHAVIIIYKENKIIDEIIARYYEDLAYSAMYRQEGQDVEPSVLVRFMGDYISRAITPTVKHYLSLQSPNDNVDEGINVVGGIHIEEI